MNGLTHCSSNRLRLLGSRVEKILGLSFPVYHNMFLIDYRRKIVLFYSL